MPWGIACEEVLEDSAMGFVRHLGAKRWKVGEEKEDREAGEAKGSTFTGPLR